MKIPKTEIEFRNAMIDAAKIGAQKAAAALVVIGSLCVKNLKELSE